MSWLSGNMTQRQNNFTWDTREADSVGADIFIVNNKLYTFIVDYHSKFLVVKQVGEFSADKPIKNYKIIFSGYRLLSKIMHMVHGSEDYDKKCYKIRETKTVCIITRTKWHVTDLPISAENYLRNKMVKVKKQQTDEKLSKLIDKFAKLHKGKT